MQILNLFRKHSRVQETSQVPYRPTAADIISVVEKTLGQKLRKVPKDPLIIRSVQEAEQIARRMGVEARFFDNLGMANNVIEALQFLQKRGVTFPPRFKIINDHALNELKDGALGRFEDTKDHYGIPVLTDGGTIYLNPLYPWDRMSAYAKALHSRKEIPVSDGIYFVLHEMGHAKHFEKAGLNSRTISGFTLKEMEALLIENGLGTNSSQNGGEFSADFFVKRLLAPTANFHEDIWGLHEYYKGPDV